MQKLAEARGEAEYETVGDEEVDREFDHTQWMDSGNTIRPMATYLLEEDDPSPDLAEGRLLPDELEQIGTRLDVARSEARQIEAAIGLTRDSYGYIPPTVGTRRSVLIDWKMESELRDHLKAQIAEEEERDRELLEEAGSLDTSADSEGLQESWSMYPRDYEGPEGGAVVQKSEEQPPSRFSRPEVPEYKFPKGEEHGPINVAGVSNAEPDAEPKRRSRFSRLEPQPEPEQQAPDETGELQWQVEEPQTLEPDRHLTLYEMLEDVQGAHYLAVYDAHARLEEDERVRMRPLVIAYLAKSRSVVEAGRVKALFRLTPVEQWTNEMLSAAILVYIRSGEQTRAFEAFRTGLREQGLTGGFEYLLIDSVNKHQWHLALDAWLVYCKDLAERHPNQRPDVEMLKPFSSLENLGGLYFLFERYLAAGERKVERFMDAQPVLKQALYMFRRMFARATLDSGCPPKQALVILSWWHNRKFYNKYIWDMVQRWHGKTINSETARELIPIYEAFRAMPNVQISDSVLSSMFQVCYPHNVQAMEQIHQDWIQMHGDLDNRGYEQFMKYYAHRGDAERVKALWAKYIKLFPDDLTDAQNFNSIINAYAQSGDVEGAKAELKRMRNEHHVAPNISIMNAMLKCYMRKGDYEASLACFREIRENFSPDPYMYAHMMAMCAKKGDLDQTIDIFNEAQDGRVPITKEMVLALVVAYCGNEEIGAAEELARRLADSDITSSAIWNQLVLHHGKKGRLSNCYKILDEMKERHIEWDHDTIDNLLQALAQVKQIAPAYEVLKTATQNQQSIVHPDHYTTVMVGAARTGDIATADAVYELLAEAGMPMPFNAIVAYTALQLERRPNAKRTESMPGKMVEALRRYVQGVEKLDVWKRRQQTRRVSWCIELLIDFRDFDAIEEVVALYTELFPEYKDGNLPPDILASLMQGYHRDNHHERIIALWDVSWPRLYRERVKSREEGIYPAHEYDLDRLVFRLADAYRSLGNSNGLASAVEEAYNAGFRLTSHTWDRVIGALALTGNWKVGVRWCETVLMRNWAGWNRRLTLRERRARANPRFLWPERRTILALREGWIAERQLAAWSAPIARALVNLDIDYPRTVNAFRDSNEPEVPGGPWIMTREITMEELLKPLSLRELKLMDKELTKYLEDEEKVLDHKKSPFRMMNEREDRLRSLDRGEMTKLQGLLDHFLSHAKEESKSEQPAHESASG